MKKRLLSIVIFFLLSFTTIPSEAIVVERIAGVVNGEIIPYSEVQVEKLLGLSEGDDREVVQSIIDRKLLLKEAEKFMISKEKGDEEKIREGLQSIKKSLGREGFYDILKAYGMTEEDITRILRERIIVDRLIEFRIRFFTIISDEAIKRYYEQHRNELGNRPLKEVYDMIREELFQIESEMRLKDYLDNLRKKSHIIINL